MFYGIQLILLSILAVPSLLVSRKPNAQEIIDKLAPFQGWIGVIFCFSGIWGIISALMNMGWLTSYPIWWCTWLAGSVVQAVLGFLLGYGLINKYLLSKNETAKAKGQETLAKLAPIQGTMGMVGIGVGIWMIVASILFGVV